MSKELDMLKHELDRRMFDLAKMSGTNKQRAEVYRTMQVIRRIESLHSCTNCLHWGGKYWKHCEEPWFEQCGRQVEDKFIPKEGEMDE